ncbi:paired immunoglobulin-like type 2 receptor alpha [Anolis sagrei]|uniref:paired immunoglobulin-like type 2 receptor alpha n=1 Tax=Anolis sagrei TaxID=38937 RepID=UPI00351FA089
MERRKEDACGVCAGVYELWQPCEVQAEVSGSVVLPCTFRHSWGPTLKAQVSWHAGYFRSNIVVFNKTEMGSVPVQANFSGRASLEGDPLSGDASLRIVDLRQSDSSRYFCRVDVWTEKHGWKVWQGINGTRLNVTAMGRKDPTAAPPTSSPLGLALGVGAAVLMALALLGLGVFLARRRGYCRRPPPGRSSQTVEKDEPRGAGHEYAEVAAKGSKAPPPSAPEDPHLCYAALTLSEAGRQGEVRPPPSETMYAAIRT